MSGRYALAASPAALRALFGYADEPLFPPRYNIAPTQPVPVVLLERGLRRFRLMRWGFIPGWVKDPKDFPLVINIRAETAGERASFRAALRHRRALMPADAFYEWQRLGPRESRPYLLRRPDRRPFAFAALHETWMGADGGEIDTVALLNTTANGAIAAIHERSPVILPEADWSRWLDPLTPAEAAQALLRPPAADLLELVRIGPRVNKASHDDAAVQQPWEPDEPKREGPGA